MRFNGGGTDTTVNAEMEKSEDKEMVVEKTKAGHGPKEGSVFPVKRRSVKQMIYVVLFCRNKKKNNQ